MQFLGFSYTKKLPIYLKFKFSWASNILSEVEFKQLHAAGIGGTGPELSGLPGSQQLRKQVRQPRP